MYKLLRSMNCYLWDNLATAYSCVVLGQSWAVGSPLQGRCVLFAEAVVGEGGLDLRLASLYCDDG